MTTVQSVSVETRRNRQHLLSTVTKRFLLREAACLLPLLILFGGWGFIRADQRSDQFRTLVQISGITTPQDMRESERNGSINREDFPAALFYFIELDHPPSVENLLAVGVNVQAKNERDETPLQLAQRLRRTEIVALLRQKEARPQAEE